jgi:hypothetical protein
MIQNGLSHAMKTIILTQHFHNTKMHKLTPCIKHIETCIQQYNVLKYQITKSDLRSYKLGLYPIHRIIKTLFTFEPIQD